MNPEKVCRLHGLSCMRTGISSTSRWTGRNDLWFMLITLMRKLINNGLTTSMLFYTLAAGCGNQCHGPFLLHHHIGLPKDMESRSEI